MLIGYLLIWMIMFFIFKYDIKQNNTDAIIRTTCFTLLSYVILQYGVKEYFKEGNTSDGDINTPDTATIAENPITIQLAKYKKKKFNKKKKCDYLKDQKHLTTNSLYQIFGKLIKSPSITKTDVQIVQSNFNDLFAIKDADTDCVTDT